MGVEQVYIVECDGCSTDHCLIDGPQIFYSEEDAKEGFFEHEGKLYCRNCAERLKLVKPRRERLPKKGTWERKMYDMTASVIEDYAKNLGDQILQSRELLERIK